MKKIIIALMVMSMPLCFGMEAEKQASQAQPIAPVKQLTQAEKENFVYNCGRIGAEIIISLIEGDLAPAVESFQDMDMNILKDIVAETTSFMIADEKCDAEKIESARLLWCAYYRGFYDRQRSVKFYTKNPAAEHIIIGDPQAPVSIEVDISRSKLLEMTEKTNLLEAWIMLKNIFDVCLAKVAEERNIKKYDQVKNQEFLAALMRPGPDVSIVSKL